MTVFVVNVLENGELYGQEVYSTMVKAEEAKSRIADSYYGAVPLITINSAVIDINE